MTTIGYATLQIIPVLSGVSEAISKQTGAISAQGRTVGKALGDGIAGGVAQAAKAVETASAKAVTARTKEADAAGKVKVAEAQLATLREKGVTDAGRLAAAEEKVASAKRGAETASKNLATAEKNETTAADKLTEAQKKTNKAHDDGVTSSTKFSGALGNMKGKLSETSGGVEGLTGKIKGLGGTISANLGFAAGAGLAGLAASVLAMGDTFASVNKVIAFTTGASGEKLDALNESVKTIGRDSPKSLGDIATALANVARSTQLTGTPLELLTKQLLKLNTMGVDVDIQTITQTMRAFNVPAEDMSAQLDSLFKIARDGGEPLGELISTLQTGAPQLVEFGLSAEDSARLLDGLFQAGIKGDTAMAGLNKALKNVSAQGGDVKDNLAKAIGGIKGLSDAGDQAGAIAAASKLFGGKAFAPMIKAIQDGKLNLDGLSESLDSSQKGILDSGGAVATLSGAWQLMKNNVLILLEPIVTKIFGVMQDGIKWFRGEGVEAIRGFGDKLKALWNSAPVQEFVGKVAELFDQWWPKITATVGTLSTAIMEVGSVAGPILVDAFSLVATAVQGIVSAGAGLIKFFTDNKEIAIILGVALAAMYGPAIAGLLIWNAGMIASRVVMLAITTATKVWAAAQWLLNAALTANPIGIVIAAIAGLVAGLVYAYNHSETFRNIVQGAWNGIKLAVGAAWDWIKTNVLPGLKAAWDAIAAGAMWLWNNAIKPAWEGIKLAFQIAWAAVKIIFEAWKLEWKILADAAMWLWHNAIEPVWEGIKVAFNAGWAIVKGIFDIWKGAWTAVGDGAMWLWHNAIEPVWDGIKAAFSAAWEFISPIFDKIQAGWETLKSGVLTVADAIGNGVKGAFSGLVDIIKAPLHALGTFLAAVPSQVLGVDIPGISTIHSWGTSLQGLSDGGYTGNKPTNEIAGVVHGDEFVVRAPARRTIENLYPGLLDFMNGTGRLPGYEGGGRVTADALKKYAQGISGGHYVRGGPAALDGTDCSGAQAAIANFITGGSGRFATAGEGEALAARGFKPGDPPPGVAAYWVGWLNGGPGGGHTAGTIVDPANGNVNVEMGGASGGGAYGGNAGGASGFPNRAWLQILATNPNGGELPPGVGQQDGSAGPTAAAGGSTGGSGLTLATSFSGLAATGLSGLNVKTKVSENSEERTFAYGDALAAGVSGQVSSALGVLGIPDAPPILQAASQLLGGIQVGGKGLLDFGSGDANAGPLAAQPLGTGGTAPQGGDHLTGANPGPGNTTTFNIQTARVEDAFLAAQQREREEAAAMIQRF